MRKTPFMRRSGFLVTANLVLVISSCAKHESATPAQKAVNPPKVENVELVTGENPTAMKGSQKESKTPKTERVHVVIDGNTVATQDAETIIEPIWSIANLKSKAD